MRDMAALMLTALIFARLARTADIDACTPQGVGLGPGDGLGGVEAMRLCGVSVIRGAFAPGQIQDLRAAFHALPEAELEALRHGAVREKRLQTHLPFSGPFSGLDLLGVQAALEPVLAAALGDDFVLDLATVVEVPPGAKEQEPHRDTPKPGHVAVMIPLYDLAETDAPLGICAGTADIEDETNKAVFREAFLWKQKGESVDEAKRRLFCGGRQQTDVLEFTVDATSTGVRLKEGRLGGVVMGFKSKQAEAYAWKVGDEVTHANGKAIAELSDWTSAVKASKGKPIKTRVERPHAGSLPPPPRRVVGAPLAVGDCLIYDSRSWHWGMAHTSQSTRYAVYVNFKASASHDGVHPEAQGNAKLWDARQAFQGRLSDIRGAASRQKAEL